jgi:oligoribonuclease NrnB/cAMP/cGMP phosphodiesterase (DHH superfamily)
VSISKLPGCTLTTKYRRSLMEQKIYCIYHSADLDGKASAAIVLKKYPNAILVPYDYGDYLSVLKFAGSRVIMVDVSLQPFRAMVNLAKICDLTWIDHHKTAIEEFRDYLEHTTECGNNGVSVESAFPGEIVLKVGMAACELTWRWAFPDTPIPLAIHHLGRHDVWDHSDPYTLLFQYGMQLQPSDPEDPAWGVLFEGDGEMTDIIASVMQAGDTVQQVHKNQNKKLCRMTAFESDFEGLKCICANSPHRSSSFFDSVWDAEKYDAMLMFYWDTNGTWTVSLYSDKEDIDVGAVAKRRGGGGHKGAAGFQAGVLPEELGIPYNIPSIP